MGKKPLNLGVLVSGSGTNLQAIIDACRQGKISGQVKVVISNSEKAYALRRAYNCNITALHYNFKDFGSREEYDRKLIAVLKEYQVDLVILAGYMLLVGVEFVQAFKNRIMNIHPALLPSFPGTEGVHQALSYGVKVTGVTVHFVDEGCDTGPIILQEPVPVKEDDSEESLAERVHQVEHRLFPRAIQLYAQGRLKLEGRKVRILSSSPSLSAVDDIK